MPPIAPNSTASAVIMSASTSSFSMVPLRARPSHRIPRAEVAIETAMRGEPIRRFGRPGDHLGADAVAGHTIMFGR